MGIGPLSLVTLCWRGVLCHRDKQGHIRELTSLSTLLHGLGLVLFLDSKTPPPEILTNRFLWFPPPHPKPKAPGESSKGRGPSLSRLCRVGSGIWSGRSSATR